jgi:glucose/mannose-6-phosphate isomerase
MLMNLDDFSAFAQLDAQDMLGHIDRLPDQLQQAWDLSQRLPLPDFTNVERVVIAGMGGSAIGADLLASYVAPLSRAPVFVHRDYELPAWAQAPHTLVIASSHSGNTEETLSAFETARSRGCQVLALSTGGKLAALAEQAGYPVWRFEHKGQPRSAVGYSFGLLLGAFFRLGLIPDPSKDLAAAAAAMRRQQESLAASQPTVKNLAKREAGQLCGRFVVVMGSGYLAPVARRWKGQLSEVAKAWAQFEFLPEADHNTLAGVVNPPELLDRLMVLFLRAPSDHPRNARRSELTRKAFMLEGFNTDFMDAQGETPLEHMWTLLHLGDYVAYYLAMVYGVDPTPVDAIEGFKKELG